MKAPIIVELIPEEMALAETIGLERYRESRRQGLQDRHGFRGDYRKTDLYGAMGELAFCTAFRIKWNRGVNTFKGADALSNIQIRTTDIAVGSLIIRPNDVIENNFILVVIQQPNVCVIKGWIRGDRGRNAMWWAEKANRPGAWFVPQSALNEHFDWIEERVIA